HDGGVAELLHHLLAHLGVVQRPQLGGLLALVLGRRAGGLGGLLLVAGSCAARRLLLGLLGLLGLVRRRGCFLVVLSHDLLACCFRPCRRWGTWFRTERRRGPSDRQRPRS